MDKLLAIGICILFMADQSTAQALFPFKENGLWGYMDSTGRTLLVPIWEAVGDFSEGLAPAAVNGVYGYTDTCGQMIIDPIYDYAEPFFRGMGRVWLNGEELYIEKNGKPVPNLRFRVTDPEAAFAVVRTESLKYGVVDTSGRFMLDTVFSSIKAFGDVFITHRKIEIQKQRAGRTYTSTKYLIHIYNKSIQEIMFPDWVNSIQDDRTCYLRLTEYPSGQVPENFTPRKIYMDQTGNLMTESIDGIWPVQHSGIPGLNIVKSANRTKDSPDNYMYEKMGWQNSNGTVIYPATNSENIYPFSEGRAFVGSYTKGFRLYNTLLQPIGSRIFKGLGTVNPSKKPPYWHQPREGLFSRGLALIDGQQSPSELIDTLGNTVAKFSFRVSQIEINDSFCLALKSDGRWTFLDPVTFAPIGRECLQWDRQFGYRNGLLRIQSEDGRLAYCDRHGKVIWMASCPTCQSEAHADYAKQGCFNLYAPNSSANLSNLNLHHQLDIRPYIIPPVEKTKKNEAENKQVRSTRSTKGKNQSLGFQKSQWGIVLNENKKCSFYGQYNGITGYLYNNTPDTITFELFLPLQMTFLDKDSVVVNLIEPRDYFCDSGEVEPFLPPYQYWEFVVPVLSGHRPFPVRASIFLNSGIYPMPEKYFAESNPVIMSINPGQFWRPKSPLPEGFMYILPHNNKTPYFEAKKERKQAESDRTLGKRG